MDVPEGRRLLLQSVYRDGVHVRQSGHVSHLHAGWRFAGDVLGELGLSRLHRQLSRALPVLVVQHALHIKWSRYICDVCGCSHWRPWLANVLDECRTWRAQFIPMQVPIDCVKGGVVVSRETRHACGRLSSRAVSRAFRRTMVSRKPLGEVCWLIAGLSALIVTLSFILVVSANAFDYYLTISAPGRLLRFGDNQCICLKVPAPADGQWNIDCVRDTFRTRTSFWRVSSPEVFSGGSGWRIPLNLFLPPILGALIGIVVIGRRLRYGPGACNHCGYSLTGLPEPKRCPECGTVDSAGPSYAPATIDREPALWRRALLWALQLPSRAAAGIRCCVSASAQARRRIGTSARPLQRGIVIGGLAFAVVFVAGQMQFNSNDGGAGMVHDSTMWTDAAFVESYYEAQRAICVAAVLAFGIGAALWIAVPRRSVRSP